MTTEKTANTSVHIPVELKKKAQLYAFNHDTNLTQLIIRALNNYLKP